MKSFCLEVSGPFACFTRPEMKVERVSYDVITPSAARAVFDAILWKPAIVWRVLQIEVLNPIRWISVRRNEVDKLASPKTKHILIEDSRQQRAGLLLRDVKYRLYANFDYIPPERRCMARNPVPDWMVDAVEAADMRKDESPAKYATMFERRARKGQCFHQPYFGCREFACDFRLVNADEEPAIPIAEDRDLGWMLYDMDFTNPNDIKPMFFRPTMIGGVIVTDRNKVEVYQ